MFKILANLQKESLNYFCTVLLITLLPILILSSSVLINLSVVIICFLFLFSYFKEKKYNIFQDKLFIILFSFWAIILINLFLSLNFENSLLRSVGFLRFIIFVAALIYFINLKKFEFLKFILFFWIFIFTLISFDLLFEFIFGKNTLGFSSYMPGRLAGVLNNELKIGNYYLGFYFITIASIITYFKNKNFIILFSIVFFTIIAFLIGERANFLRIFVGLIIFLLFWNKFNIKLKIFALILIITSISLFFNLNKDLNYRFNDAFLEIVLKKNGILNYLYNSQYGAHYSTSYKIFKSHPLTGTGIKNFWGECLKEKYHDEKYLFTESRCSTHPHQFHLEILSQLGIFGYLTFIILFIYFIIRGIINYQKNKNILHLGSLIFIFTMIFLPLPTGIFFTTYGATIFWINFAIALIFEKKTYINDT